MNIIEQLDQEQMETLTNGKTIPDFAPGDTLQVNVKVVEGTRERVRWPMKASASRARAAASTRNFTVRKISYGEGVERVFPLYSPLVDSIKVIRKGRVRRAKLYYLRGLRGKAARITEKQDKTPLERDWRRLISSAYAETVSKSGQGPDRPRPAFLLRGERISI